MAQVGEVPLVGGPGFLPGEDGTGDHLAAVRVHLDAVTACQRSDETGEGVVDGGTAMW